MKTALAIATFLLSALPCAAAPPPLGTTLESEAFAAHTASSLPPAVTVSPLIAPQAGNTELSRATSTLSTSGFEMNYSLRRTLQGSALTHDRVRVPDVELSVWRTLGKNTFSLASDVEMPRTARVSRILETSFFASRSLQRGTTRIEPGFYLYLRDRNFGRSTGEVVLSIGRRTGALRWFADGFADVLRARGDYLLQAGISHRFAPDERSLLRTSFLVGRSSERSSTDFGRLAETSNYFTLSASLTRDLASHLALRPHIEATRFLSGDTHTFFKFGVALEWNA